VVSNRAPSVALLVIVAVLRQVAAAVGAVVVLRVSEPQRGQPIEKDRLQGLEHADALGFLHAKP